MGHAATDVEQHFEQVDYREKFERLCGLLEEVSEQGEPLKTIVFANTKGNVDEIASDLRSKGIKAAPMHGGRPDIQALLL